MREFTFQVGDIVPAQFLNQMQELVSDWTDGALLQATTNQIYIDATPSAPLELVIDGQYRISTGPMAATVTAGACGLYEIQAITTGFVDSFKLVATDGTYSSASGYYSKTLGWGVWDGSSFSSATAVSREINASKVNNKAPSVEPGANSVPLTDSSGVLATSWIDFNDTTKKPVGAVRKFWFPSGATIQVPSTCEPMNGQDIAPEDHNFNYVGTITLPDMRNAFSIGADPSAIYGTPGNDHGQAPGLGATAGGMEVRVPSHAHIGGIHDHDLATHAHAIGHSHEFPHDHTMSRTGYIAIKLSPVDANIERNNTTLSGTDEMGGVWTTSAIHTATSGVAAGSLATSSGSVTDYSGTGFDTRPRFYAPVYYMKVRNNG